VIHLTKNTQRFFDVIIPSNHNEAKKMIAFASYLGIKYLLMVINNLITKINETALSEIIANMMNSAHKYSIELKFAYLFRDIKTRDRIIFDRLFDRLQIVKMLDISCEKWKEHLRREVFHVFFVTFDNLQQINKGVYEVARAKRKYFIISLRTLIFSDKSVRAKLLLNARKNIDILNKSDFNLLFGSGATNINEMRNPRDIRSFLKLLEVRDDIASLSISQRARIFFFLHKPYIIIH